MTGWLINGQDGSTGKTYGGTPTVFGIDGPFSGATANQLRNLSVTDSRGVALSPQSGDWLIDSHPSLYVFNGTSWTKAADLPAGAKGPAGTAAAQHGAHTHKFVPRQTHYDWIKAKFAGHPYKVAPASLPVKP